MINIKTARIGIYYYALSSAAIFLIILYVDIWRLINLYGYFVSCFIVWIAVEKIKTKKINSLFLLIFAAGFLSAFQWWFDAKFSHLFFSGADISLFLSRLDPCLIYPRDIDAMKIQVPLFFVAIFIGLKIKKPMKNQSSQSQSGNL